jgi:hypothetical protein
MKTTPTTESPVRRIREVARHVERYTGFLPCLLPDRERAAREARGRAPVDLLYAPLDEEFRAILVVTAGGAPEELDCEELAFCLPPGWPLAYRGLHGDLGGSDGRRAGPAWPLRMLRDLRRRAAESAVRERFLRIEIPGRFAGVLLDRPSVPPEGFERLPTAVGEEIRFAGVIPLLTDEVAFAERRGADSLRARLLAAGVSELLDPDRKSALARSSSRRAG